jgi:HEAT repeat protein
MNNGPALLIRAMLSEEDDIFNTMLCRAAKCAAEVWDELPYDSQELIRKRTWGVWIEWLEGREWFDVSAVGMLGRVDEVLQKRLIDTFHIAARNPYITDEVIRVFVEIHPPSTTLVDAMQYHNSTVRRVASNVLREIGPGERLKEITVMMKHRKSSLREAAIIALGRIESTGVMPEFMQSLLDKRVLVRIAAIDALVEVGSEENAAQVIGLLSNEQSFVRECAIEVLERLGGFEVVPQLVLLLTDKSPPVRRAACRALGKIGDNRTVPSIITLLKDRAPTVREEAAQVLGEMTEPSAVTELIRLLKDDRHRSVRNAAANALGQIGAYSAVPELIKALEDDWLDIEDVANALMKIGGRGVTKEIIPNLIKRLSSEDDFTQWKAVEALGHLGADESVPVLLSCLKEKDKCLRERVAEALGRIRAREAVPELLGLLGDRNFDVQNAVADALGRIGAEEAVPLLLNWGKKNGLSFYIAVDAIGMICAETGVRALYKMLKRARDWLGVKKIRDCLHRNCRILNIRLHNNGRIVKNEAKANRI